MIRLCKCLPYRQCLEYTAFLRPCCSCGRNCKMQKVSKEISIYCMIRIMVFNAIFSNITVIPWLSVLLYVLLLRWNRLLTRGKHLCDSIISLNGEVSTHENSLIPPLSTEVFLPIRESEWSCICGRGIHVVSLNDFIIGFWKCCRSVLFLVFHFITTSLIHLKQ